MKHRGAQLGSWGLLAIALAIMGGLCAGAEVVRVEGTTAASYNSRQITQLIFYSKCSLPDQATITVKSCSNNTRISLDGGDPILVAEGKSYTAKSRIEIVSGSLSWKMEVQLNPSQGLKLDSVLEDSFYAPAGKKSGKILFEGKWNSSQSWFVVHVRVAGGVEFLHYTWWPYGQEQNLYMYTGDHVLSLSAIGAMLPCPSLQVRAGGGDSLSAKMWKWVR